MHKALLATCMMVAMCCAASSLYAASARCTVVEQDGSRVVLDCGARAETFPPGTELKVKSSRKGAKVEGC